MGKYYVRCSRKVHAKGAHGRCTRKGARGGCTRRVHAEGATRKVHADGACGWCHAEWCPRTFVPCVCTMRVHHGVHACAPSVVHLSHLPVHLCGAPNVNSPRDHSGDRRRRVHRERSRVGAQPARQRSHPRCRPARHDPRSGATSRRCASTTTSTPMRCWPRSIATRSTRADGLPSRRLLLDDRDRRRVT